MSATDRQILLAASSLTTYGGITMFTLGLIGNTLNIIAFTCLKGYRSLSTSAFLTAASLSGLIYLSFTLFRVAIGNILGYNAAARDSFLCRTTLFIPRVTVQVSLTCLCFSAIDRYLMTSRSARLRSLVTLTRARLAICFSVLIWCGYGVPNAIYAINYPLFNICVPTADFGNTITYLNLVFAVLLPIFILSVFGFLTWKNLDNARLSSMNAQVTRMILLDVIVVVMSNVPMGCFLIYAVAYTSNRLFTPVETLLIYLAQLLSSTQSCGSFYFYFCVSPAFRNNIRAMLVRVFCCKEMSARIGVTGVSATAPMVRSTMANGAT